MPPQTERQTGRVTIGNGERLLLHTDAITEASDEREEFYDVDFPLRDFLLHHRPDRAEAFIADLISDITVLRPHVNPFCC